jgi:hypothetical protein
MIEGLISPRGALGFSIKLQEKVELDSMNHVTTQCEDFSK